jgi:hypothetical protein
MERPQEYVEYYVEAKEKTYTAHSGFSDETLLNDPLDLTWVVNLTAR